MSRRSASRHRSSRPTSRAWASRSAAVMDAGAQRHPRRRHGRALRPADHDRAARRRRAARRAPRRRLPRLPPHDRAARAPDRRVRERRRRRHHHPRRGDAAPAQRADTRSARATAAPASRATRARRSPAHETLAGVYDLALRHDRQPGLGRSVVHPRDAGEGPMPCARASAPDADHRGRRRDRRRDGSHMRRRRVPPGSSPVQRSSGQTTLHVPTTRSPHRRSGASRTGVVHPIGSSSNLWRTPSSSSTITRAFAPPHGCCWSSRATRSSARPRTVSAPSRRRAACSRISCSSTSTCPTSTGSTSPSRITTDDGAPAVVLISSREGADFGPLIRRSGARGFIAKADLSGSAIEELLA